MKKVLLAITLITSFTTAKITNIEDIKGKYQQIQSKEKSYNKKVKEIDDISTEGAQATYFYDKSNLKLIKVDIYGETGKEEQEYYFDNGKVFFIYIKETSYNAPMYAKEFNSKLSKIKQKRLYFINGKLVKFLAGSKEVPKDSIAFKSEEENSLDFLKMLLKVGK